MTGGRARLALAAAVIVALLAAVALFVFARPTQPLPPERPAGERPELMLLTTLPIVFPEMLTLDAPVSPVLDALERRYRVTAISVTASGELGRRGLLMMAQPQAQPAEALVDLDAWVRGGGGVLLLADPLLAWPSERPLGDRLRAPPAFADTGLLGHWGLRLEGPQFAGPANLDIAGRQVRTVSPGRLIATGPGCTTAAHGFIARCRIGEGQATVIADADFLHVDTIEGAAGAANLTFLLGELGRLEQ